MDEEEDFMLFIIGELLQRRLAVLFADEEAIWNDDDNGSSEWCNGEQAASRPSSPIMQGDEINNAWVSISKRTWMNPKSETKEDTMTSYLPVLHNFDTVRSSTH